MTIEPDRRGRYRAVAGPEHAYAERPSPDGAPARLAADLTTALDLQQSRARLWRYPPHTRGRRHLEPAQEEVFVVLAGTLTMLLGDVPDRIELPPESVVAVEPGTPLQVRNDSDAEAIVFVYGAPPEAGTGQVLDELD